MDREYEERLARRPQGSAPQSPSSTPSPKRPQLRGSPSRDRYSDRFIPFRPEGGLGLRDMFGEEAQDAEGGAASSAAKDEPGRITYNLLLRNELLGAGVLDMKDVYYTQQQQQIKSAAATAAAAAGGSAVGSEEAAEPVVVEHNSVFSFRRDSKLRGPLATSQPESAYSLSPVGMDSQNLLLSPRRAPRKISKAPFKVLDAPELQDDFYLNLVDWSSQNVLSVGLGSCVYLWSACTSQVTKLCDLSPDDSITSVRWMQRGSHLAVGTNKGEVQLWDVSKCSKVRTLSGHTGRVGSLAWNSHILASGSRDRYILQRDVRASEQYSHRLSAHKQEVCGLQWSPDDQHLASGGNDNKLYIWTLNQQSPVQKYSEHKAAIKAIAWSPHQHGLLASGGGTADQCIRFWNTLTGQPLQCIDTKSQVCNIAWSKHSNELVSTHGYSQNQIAVWKYPSMTQVATLVGHTFRVLYLAMSPDGQTIVTGAGDETLRFWNVFSKSRSQKSPSSVLNMFSHIR